MVDQPAQTISVAIAALSLGYTVYRDRRDRPRVDFGIDLGLVMSGKAKWAEVRLVARNRGSRDVGVEGIDF